MDEPTSNILALWGAGLSTILAALKILETWKSRERIEVGYGFKGLPELGNEIIIRNLSAKPQILTYWELQWRERKLFQWKTSDRVSPDEHFQDIQIPPYSTKSLTFQNQDYFGWGHRTLAGRTIYIKLQFAGRSRPILRKVYG